jgi:predicted DNA-binding transcriptional regulator YafY
LGFPENNPHGGNVKVLKPKKIANDIQAKAENILSQYK